MLQQLLQLDTWLFYLINGIGQNAFFDFLLPLWRSQYFWSPLYLFFVTFLLFNFSPRTTLFVLAFFLLTFMLCDQLSAGVIKKIVQRLRPCKTPELLDTINLLVPCGSGKSFVSAHATNHFGIAVYVGNLFKQHFAWLKPVLLFWAAMVAYAQVYVGVHFPADVICGAVLGAVIGSVTWWALKKYYLTTSDALA